MVALVSQAEFAKRAGLHPERVAELIVGGIITGAALVGRAPAQRIDVDTALAQLRAFAPQVTMSKAEFARHIGVSKPRVTQYIRDGLIGPEALTGVGTKARILVDVAKAQIRERRNIAQAIGNGSRTRLEPTLARPAYEKSLAELINVERIEQLRRQN